MFHISTVFHQRTSLDDTTLKWEFDIFSCLKIWRCVDTGFDGILCKCNTGLVLLVEENYQPYQNFFSVLVISDASLFYAFYAVLPFLDTSIYVALYSLVLFGTSFFDNLFLFQQYLGIDTFYMPVAHFRIFLTLSILVSRCRCLIHQVFLFAILSYWFTFIIISLPFNCLFCSGLPWYFFA